MAACMDDTNISGNGTNFGVVELKRELKGALLCNMLHADLMGITSDIPNRISLGVEQLNSA